MKKEKVKKEKKRGTLQNSLILVFSLLGIVLALVIGSVVSVMQVTTKLDTVSETTFSYTKAAAQLIDGDKIDGYLETNETDDYYDEIQEFLNAYVQNSDLLYYYVFVPFDDYVVYIWDSSSEENSEGTQALGYQEAYMENGKEAVEKIYRQDPPEEISYDNDETYGYIASAYSPIFDSKGDPVAVVGADLSVPDLQTSIITSALMIVGIIVAIIVVAVFAFYYFINSKVVKPIKTLNTASKNMVEHLESEETLQIDISTNNEIQDLGESFETMYVGIKNYIGELSAVTAEKERIGAELDVARKIQASMLPCIFPPFPERDDFEIFASMNPAKEVGGDFYDFFMVDEDNLAVVVADVSGKGVPAALFMVIGKTLIKDHTTPGKDLGEVFTEVNQLLCESNSEELFITAFLGVLNLKTGNFRYVNAGHETPFIAKKGEKFKPHKVRPGFVLAGMEGIRYKAGEIQLDPGDKFFQYTDGVTEATDSENNLFGMERLEETLGELADRSPAEILSGVQASIDGFVGEAPQFDDITMLCFEYRGVQEESRQTVNPSIDNIDSLTEFVETSLRNRGASESTIMKMDIALDEIYSNIVKFSNASYAKITCGAKEGNAYLRFEDDGIEYNPLKKEDADISLDAEEREIGGLGILVVKKSMDNVEYEYKDGKNILVLTKKL